MFGYNGEKVLLNVIKAGETMRDTGMPDGSVGFRQRILEGLNANHQPVKCVAVPITSIVDYDIANLKLGLKDNYNLVDDVKRQIGDVSAKIINFSKLGEFGAKVAKEAAVYTLSLKSPGDSQRMSAFLK